MEGTNCSSAFPDSPQGEAVNASTATVDLTYTITNTGTVPAELISLETTISNTNSNATTMESFIVAGEVVPVGGDFVVTMEYEVLLLEGRRKYTIGASTRAMQGGPQCVALAAIQFDAGFIEL
jgi:hypothetical protein